MSPLKAKFPAPICSSLAVAGDHRRRSTRRARSEHLRRGSAWSVRKLQIPPSAGHRTVRSHRARVGVVTRLRQNTSRCPDPNVRVLSRPLCPAPRRCYRRRWRSAIQSLRRAARAWACSWMVRTSCGSSSTIAATHRPPRCFPRHLARSSSVIGVGPLNASARGASRVPTGSSRAGRASSSYRRWSTPARMNIEDEGQVVPVRPTAAEGDFAGSCKRIEVAARISSNRCSSQSPQGKRPTWADWRVWTGLRHSDRGCPATPTPDDRPALDAWPRMPNRPIGFVLGDGRRRLLGLERAGGPIVHHAEWVVAGRRMVRRSVRRTK